jgi:hypothetical protein
MPMLNPIPTLQAIANSFRNVPDLNPLMGQSGWTQEPTLSIANDVMQQIFAQDMDWKFNRRNASPILTVGLQQDYITNIVDMGWIEKSTLLDINNTSFPKPEFPMEAVRDLPRAFRQYRPFQVCWMYNNQATLGVWQANTLYGSSYGVMSMPNSPIQQFRDSNGNLLFIDSSVLNLSPVSAGSNGPFPAFGAAYPYGTSGSVAPFAPQFSPAGTKVADGSVIWTVADPNGITFRLNVMPARNSVAYLVNPVYQMAPPIFTSLQQTIAPIPPAYTYLFRNGFMAEGLEQAGSKKAGMARQKWIEAMAIALRADDREQNQTTLYPSDSLSSGGGFGGSIGPAWPFGW